MSRLEELRLAAGAATPGPWIYDAATLLVGCEETVDQAEATSVPDAKFIARANPETVLALIALVEELRAALAEPFPWAARKQWEVDGDTDAADLMTRYGDQRRAALASAATWMEE